MQVVTTEIPGVIILTPKRFGDNRGFFSESWNRETLSGIGIQADFVQDNHSLSEQAGTVRGLHFQAPPQAQAKLVRCGRGCLIDVVVDIRKGSPTYGQSVAVELSFDNGKQIFVPEGCLHGFATTVAGTEIIYKCTDYYAPALEGAVRFDDPDLAINWGIAPETAILSEKDQQAQAFKDLDSPFVYEATS